MKKSAAESTLGSDDIPLHRGISMGVGCSHGGRKTQDDRWNAFSFYMRGLGTQYRCTVGAVLDGHHGHEISDMCVDSLPSVLVPLIQRRIVPVSNGEDTVDSAIQHGLRDCMYELDKLAFESHVKNDRMTGGTTMLIAFIVLDTGMLYTSNVGDCKAVMSVRGGALGLTESHNPPVESEKRRFEAAGVSCFSDHIGGSDINVCRTLGDYDLGPPLKWRLPDDGYTMVHGPLFCTPDVKKKQLDDLDEFMVLATDGVWDYYTPESSVITDVRRQLRQVTSSDHATQPQDSGDFTSACMHCASWLVDAALSRQRDVLHAGTPGDNVTVLFLQLRPLPEIPRARASRLNLTSRTLQQ